MNLLYGSQANFASKKKRQKKVNEFPEKARFDLRAGFEKNIRM